MLFVAIKNYLSGYVLVKIRGDYIERFFNMCAYRNIYIWDVRATKNETTFKMSMRAFRTCRDICRKTHVRLSILKKYGAPIWIHSIKKRYFFLIGLFLFIVFFLVSSQFVWTIDIDGLVKESETEFREKLADSGLKEGVLKKKFSQTELKEKILLNDSNLSWVWVDFKGTKALVRVREKNKAPSMVPVDEACDIISNKLGIVVRKNVRTGVCNYQIGDTVFPGDVIISGTVVSENENVAPWYVHADGTIFLRTCYEKVGNFQLFEEKKIYTGNVTKKYTLHVLGHDIPLSFGKTPQYELCDKVRKEHDLTIGKEHYIGIGCSVDSSLEYQTVKVPLSFDEAKRRAKKKMKEEMNKCLALNYIVVSEDFSFEQTSDTTIQVTMSGQYEEQVGIERAIDKTAEIEDINAKENK